MYGKTTFLSTGRFTLLLCHSLCVKFHEPTLGGQVITPEEMEDCREDDSYERGREAALKRNPDCRDPEHLGCEFCEHQGEEDDLLPRIEDGI